MLRPFGETLCKGKAGKEMYVLWYCFVFYENKFVAVGEPLQQKGICE